MLLTNQTVPAGHRRPNRQSRRGDATGGMTGGSSSFPLLFPATRDLGEQFLKAPKRLGMLLAGEDAVCELRAQFGDFGVDVEELGQGEPPLS